MCVPNLFTGVTSPFLIKKDKRDSSVGSHHGPTISAQRGHNKKCENNALLEWYHGQLSKFSSKTDVGTPLWSVSFSVNKRTKSALRLRTFRILTFSLRVEGDVYT